MEIDKIFLDNFTQAENLYKENKLLESLKLSLLSVINILTFESVMVSC